MDSMFNTFRCLSEVPKLIVVDREFKNEEFFRGQNANTVICWNHLYDNLKRKAREMATSLSREQEVALKSNFRDIMLSRSEERVDEKVNTLFDGSYRRGPLFKGWANPQFQEYFRKYVLQDIKDHSVRYKLEEFGFHRVRLDAKGITNNAAESMNKSLKDFAPEKEYNTWYKGALNAYHFCRSYDTMIQAGYHNTGESCLD